MTLQQILDLVALKYPHGYTNDQIVSLINDIQKRLFRTMYKPTTADTYDIIADNAFYPVDYSPENIIDVVVNGEEYTYQNIQYDAVSDKYWYIEEDNSIGIYPTPTADATSGLTVFHYMEPTELSASDTSAAPDFDKAWHEIIVAHVCRQLATIAQDSVMVNNFTADVNELETAFKRSKRARPHRIQDVYGINGGWVC